MPPNQRIKYAELPPGIQSEILEKDFLRACLSLNGKNIVVWVVDRTANHQRELEWERASGRFVPTAERQAALGALEAIHLPLFGVQATLRYIIDADWHTLQVHYTLRRAGSDEYIGEASQHCYSPVVIEHAKFVEQEFQRLTFPQQYAGWVHEEKVRYWVIALYRYRRVAGESGHEEDSVFSSKLIDDMRKLDPSIEQVLPDVIRHLAKMEMEDVVTMAKSFADRTGMKPGS